MASYDTLWNLNRVIVIICFNGLYDILMSFNSLEFHIVVYDVDVSKKTANSTKSLRVFT